MYVCTVYVYHTPAASKKTMQESIHSPLQPDPPLWQQVGIHQTACHWFIEFC